MDINVIESILRDVIVVAEDWYEVRSMATRRNLITYHRMEPFGSEPVARFHWNSVFGPLFQPTDMAVEAASKIEGLHFDKPSMWFTYRMPEHALTHTLRLNPVE